MQLATSKWIQRKRWGTRKYKIVTRGKKIRNSSELKSIVVIQCWFQDEFPHLKWYFSKILKCRFKYTKQQWGMTTYSILEANSDCSRYLPSTPPVIKIRGWTVLSAQAMLRTNHTVFNVTFALYWTNEGFNTN